MVEVPTDHGPLAAKGVGDPPVIPTAAAVAKANVEAIVKRPVDLPMTPPVILGLE
jgi:CO/xanthine dehydrogenase Mo-binding subunit